MASEKIHHTPSTKPLMENGAWQMDPGTDFRQKLIMALNYLSNGENWIKIGIYLDRFG